MYVGFLKSKLGQNVPGTKCPGTAKKGKNVPGTKCPGTAKKGKNVPGTKCPKIITEILQDVIKM